MYTTQILSRATTGSSGTRCLSFIFLVANLCVTHQKIILSCGPLGYGGLRDTGGLGDYLAGSHLISGFQDPSKTLRPRRAWIL